MRTICVRPGFRDVRYCLKTYSDLVPSVRFELTLDGF